METISLQEKGDVVLEENCLVVLDSAIKDFAIIEEIGQEPKFSLDEWITYVDKEINILYEKAGIIRGLALGAHLKNLRPMVCYYYTNCFLDESLRKEVESIIVLVQKIFIGHYPDGREAREAGSCVFHFMLNLIEKGKELRFKEQEMVMCVVGGCGEKAINSHTISRANNFRRGVNYYSLKSRIRDEGKANSGIYLGRVIASNASTRHMFCATHDRDLFQSIEGDSNLDIENTSHMYLQNWRTFLWENNADGGYIRNMRKELEKNPQLLNQRTLTMSKVTASNSIDEQFFINESKDIIYFALTFTNKTPILASFCEDLSLLAPNGENNKKSGQYFYFHLLHNNDKHCLIISGFRTPEMESALKNLKAVYEKDNFEFWQKVFNFVPLKKNIFFNETFAFNDALTTKLKQIYLTNQEVKNRSFMRSLPITFSKKELFSFFGMSRLFSNI